MNECGQSCNIEPKDRVSDNWSALCFACALRLVLLLRLPLMRRVHVIIVKDRSLIRSYDSDRAAVNVGLARQAGTQKGRSLSSLQDALMGRCQAARLFKVFLPCSRLLYLLYSVPSYRAYFFHAPSTLFRYAFRFCRAHRPVANDEH